MKKLLLSSCFAAALAACASPQVSSPVAAQCMAPHLAPAELRIGDGALDRGFIGGVSFADVDGDGDLDLYAARGYYTNQTSLPLQLDRSMLYINDGRGGFSREESSALSNNSEPASGSTWGDVDQDGDLDVFVATELGRPDAFYRNLGGGRFAREQLGDATTTRGGNFTATWVDIDGDGDLDLVSGGPTLEPVGPNLVYRNDNGAFVRVADTPVANGASNPGAVLWADLDGDGDQDFFVANSDISRMSQYPAAEYESSQLFLNDGAWHFTRTTGQAFERPEFPALGAALGDIDNDGDLDLFLQAQPGGDLPGGRRRMADHMFRNDGAGHFALDATLAGSEHDDVAGGAAFADFDLDGDLDLVVAAFDTGVILYANDGHGVFAPVDDPILSQLVSTHAAITTGDIDGDGDIDVAIGNWGERPEGDYVRILRNETPACGHPVRVRLHDRAGAPDPIGARVTLVTHGPHGERRQMRESAGQTTFRGQSGDQLYFGVPMDERVIALEIRWPGGRTQIIREVHFDSVNDFREPTR
jgi:hypothetical protein